MRLSKIKLAGFKSFVDPTTIHFPSNLVGIVGPNGCGKSNTIDAVRWVMGESSAKNLRGESMSDVIFNGSTGRKPVGQAGIELVFDNSDGGLGGQYAQYAEISIKRQVSRDGQSAYFLNGARCRRRDITDIFLGTGLGPRSYSIIEQGMISRLIEARPEDLRVFLEEAAGISKYKERRRETENRMRHTSENLARLNDLRDELEKQLEKLNRQARTAEKFKELREQERRVKAELLTLRHDQMQGQNEQQARAIAEQETNLEAVIAAQRAVEAAMEKNREQHVELVETFNEVQGHYYELGAEVARVEQAIQHARETRQRQQQELTQADEAWNEVEAHIRIDGQRLEELEQELLQLEPELEELRARAEVSSAALAEAEQAMQQWQNEWDDFNRRAAEPAQTAEVERTRINHLERQLQQQTQRLERLRQEHQGLSAADLELELEALAEQEQEREARAQQLQEELEQVRGGIEGLRGQLQGHNNELNEARGRQQDLRGRLASLEALQQAALGQGSGAVNQWLESRGLGQAPRLAQQLEVEAGWERAVETVLGDSLQAVCVDGVDPVAEWLDSLEQGTLTLVDTRASGTTATAAGELVPLSSKVKAAWSLDSLLGDVFVADSLGRALALRGQLQARQSIVTPEGIWLSAGWLRVARDEDQQAGVLAREKEIGVSRAALAEAEEAIEQFQEALDQAREALQDNERRRDELQVEVNQAHRAHSELRAQLGARRSRLDQVQDRIKTLAGEIAELDAQQERDTAEHAQARSRLHEALSAMEALASEREERAARREELRRTLDDTRARAQADRDGAQGIGHKLQSQRTVRDNTTHNLERMRSQETHLQQRREELRAALESSAEPLREMEEELTQSLSRRRAVETELAEARRRVEAIEHDLRIQEQDRGTKERASQELREALSQARIASQEIRVRSQTLLEQLEETGFELEALRQELPEEANAQAWEEEAERLAQRIQRLGPINLAAIEEYDEQSERKQYLDAQHKDISDALETLESAIHKIDRETRTRFKETFDKVNSGIQELFPRLFGGGHAYLELTGEDLLDTGVTVMARPPGKRNSTIHLLSGGEKALTAVALVFAIFRLNPSPFCMLDEVDAPLDDANVGRFCDLVREMSETVQFIFITHNKITMELSNQLTGVTMHEPGVSRLVAVDVDEAVQMAAM
ncbi:MAG: chromosome segregation protein SMC [Gammaproteobacteria bacterium]|nr:chromosome segregation protein SMC [Gammaproteobacteria bacterium]